MGRDVSMINVGHSMGIDEDLSISGGIWLEAGAGRGF